MTKTTDNSPSWQPKEIAFLREKGVIAPDQSPSQLNRIKERWIHQTLREVFLSSTGFVVKRFTLHPGRKDRRPVWKREHQALRRLSGLNVPRTLGFITCTAPDGIKHVCYVRQLLPGSPLDTQEDKAALAMADLLAAIHRRGVVTLDPQQDNFISPASSANGELAFIDMGRARCFKIWNPQLYLNIGKEMVRLQREGGLTAAQFQAYLSRYQAIFQPARPAQWLIAINYRHWTKRYDRKDRKRAKRVGSS